MHESEDNSYTKICLQSKYPQDLEKMFAGLQECLQDNRMLAPTNYTMSAETLKILTTAKWWEEVVIILEIYINIVNIGRQESFHHVQFEWQVRNGKVCSSKMPVQSTKIPTGLGKNKKLCPQDLSSLFFDVVMRMYSSCN